MAGGADLEFEGCGLAEGCGVVAASRAAKGSIGTVGGGAGWLFAEGGVGVDVVGTTEEHRVIWREPDE